ncbi:hypothetical protein [Salmonirosea aquatica]|uniref:Phosphatase PAP2 family protein n=1 Tax=Salmonirosea aquatica TaxID=2654236 RepID=A0A7C9BJ56_9BACT|nr:hypothetical protein [Cytophagaceae bacterium SJW1-29]
MKKRFSTFFLLVWSCTFSVQSQPGGAGLDSVGHAPTLESFRVKPFIIPAALATSGLLVQGKISRQLQQRVVMHHPDFRTHADDYLLFAPAALSLGLGAAGVKGKHPFGEQVLLAVISGLAQGGVTYILKGISKYPRPDGTTNDAFPSGHTSSAFASATLLHEEYGYRSVWYSVGGMG